MTTKELMDAEVKWYLVHGKHGYQRLAKSRDGSLYVIGDLSWNYLRTFDKEVIEPRMKQELND